MPAPVQLAVLGGSGFYEMPGLEEVEEITLDTPFGPPSDAIRIGTLDGVRVAFLARHGRGHTILPAELPQRANLWALKSIGVRRSLAVSAVGSLRGELQPGEMVVPDQLVDRTRGGRPQTFFGDGVVAHIGFADPFCPSMRPAVLAAARAAGARTHDGGTYVVIEGPAFGTRAESELYRSWGLDIVGMTALPEAKLAREAEICYATLAAITDYDSWNAAQEAVEASTVFEVLRKNVEKSRDAVRNLVNTLGSLPACECGTALDRGLVTPPEAISEGTIARLGPLLSRRLGAEL